MRSRGDSPASSRAARTSAPASGPRSPCPVSLVTTPADPGRWLRLVCASGAQILEYVPLRFSTKPRQRPGLTGGRALRLWRCQGHSWAVTSVVACAKTRERLLEPLARGAQARVRRVDV